MKNIEQEIANEIHAELNAIDLDATPKRRTRKRAVRPSQEWIDGEARRLRQIAFKSTDASAAEKKAAVDKLIELGQKYPRR